MAHAGRIPAAQAAVSPALTADAHLAPADPAGPRGPTESLAAGGMDGAVLCLWSERSADRLQLVRHRPACSCGCLARSRDPLVAHVFRQRDQWAAPIRVGLDALPNQPGQGVGEANGVKSKTLLLE